MKRFAKYLLAMALPLGVLLVRPLTPALVLTLGQEILLATEPIDPRDIFRGDYVDLRFEIEEVSAELLASRDIAEDEADDGDYHAYVYESGADLPYLYVTLSPDKGGICRPVLLTREAPAEGVYVRGRRYPHYSWGDRSVVRLDYGDSLRRFYVKENTGLELEEAARRGKVEAVARVWKGRIVLESLRMKEKKQ